MSRTILCTVGTSIAPPSKNATTVPDRIKQHVADCKQRHGSNRDAFQRAVSAEINSLRAMGTTATDHVVLIHTDTDDGQRCASEIRALVEEHFACSTEVRRVPGLQVTDGQRFRQTGVKELFHALDHFVVQAHDRPVVINATGGFKLTVPYITLFGLFRGLETVYIFERSAELITLPAVPIAFDFERLESVRPALTALRERGSMNSDEFWALVRGVPHDERTRYECFVEKIDDALVPSAFTELLWSDLSRTALVRLSTAARQDYEKSEGTPRSQFEFMLDRVAEAGYRRQHLHAFPSTDLDVIKPGNTGERMAFYLDGNTVRVCRLLRHDEYERTLGGLSKADFANSEFTRWKRPADRPVPATSDEDQLRELVVAREQSDARAETALEAQHRAEARCNDLESELLALQIRHESLVSDLAANREIAERSRNEVRSLREELSAARSAAEQNSARARVRALPSAALRFANNVRHWLGARDTRR